MPGSNVFLYYYAFIGNISNLKVKIVWLVQIISDFFCSMCVKKKQNGGKEPAGIHRRISLDRYIYTESMTLLWSLLYGSVHLEMNSKCPKDSPFPEDKCTQINCRLPGISFSSCASNVALQEMGKMWLTKSMNRPGDAGTDLQEETVQFMKESRTQLNWKRSALLKYCDGMIYRVTLSNPGEPWIQLFIPKVSEVTYPFQGYFLRFLWISFLWIILVN